MSDLKITNLYKRYGNVEILTTAVMRWFWDHYADPADRTSPLAAPLRGELAGLPPAVVVTADFDPLRDEGLAYAQAGQFDRAESVWRALLDRSPADAPWRPELEQRLNEIERMKQGVR